MFLKSDKPQINNNNAIQSNKKKTGKKDIVKEVHQPMLPQMIFYPVIL
jgi:hypothetical protein